MKTILTSIFIFLNGIVISQTTDILIIPKENTAVLTFQPHKSLIGVYAGGYYLTQFTYPVYYTTPLVFFNRLGLTFGTNKASFMFGTKIDLLSPIPNVRPDIWFKINPVRIFSNKNTGLDFSLGLNFSRTLNYGVGMSISY